MRVPTALRIVLPIAVLLLVGLVFASSSDAASGWWSVGVGARPSVLPAGGVGEVVVSAENVGDGPVSGDVVPVSVDVSLPAGLRAIGVSGGAPFGNAEGLFPGCV